MIPIHLLVINVWFGLEKLLLIGAIISFSLVVAMYTTFAERKIAGFMQDRRGPNRAGPFGILQPLADGLKLFFKEEIIPLTSNKGLFVLGPALAMLTAMLTSAVIPWGNQIEIAGRTVSLQVADVNIGILYVFGVVSLGVYGIMIGGWSSNNKFSLLAAVRGASQIISYELAMGLSLISLLLMTGSLNLKSIVEQQMQGGWGGLLGWNILYQPLAFLIFLICVFAECNRTPFDLPEAENELNFGYHQEYSSMKLGLYLFSEYVNMFISSAVVSTLFFGGYDIPFVDETTLASNIGVNLVALLGFLTFFAKIAFFLFLFIWVRWTIPRFRYDQLMDLGWKKLIPLALANLLITAVVILALNK
ncbi:MAG: NADH-quinone oxidoreductase subunit NuoH [Bacteroidetes bacterium]|nr:NADH-quinone oxidoreductase subunit NuoH [Bacteroidota bacterium]